MLCIVPTAHRHASLLDAFASLADFACTSGHLRLLLPQLVKGSSLFQSDP